VPHRPRSEDAAQHLLDDRSDHLTPADELAPGTDARPTDSTGVAPRTFRQVLGRFPTGVTVVTAITDAGPVGLSIGSFTSVSLDPPLVGFLPARHSRSWPLIRTAGRFCVNVLGAGQAHLARQFASPRDDRFGDVPWRPAPFSGAPLLEGVIAWIDCALESTAPAGDHLFVLGRVHRLDAVDGGDPLVFFRGGYHALGG